MEPQCLGNMSLLTLRKVGFLASRKVKPISVIPSIDWANRASRDPNIAIVSGFQSTLEREVLDIALSGTCGIIYVLNRSLYRQIPPNLRHAYNANRILFISLTTENTIRPSTANASVRNRYIANISDALVISSITIKSSLFHIVQNNKHKITQEFP